MTPCDNIIYIRLVEGIFCICKSRLKAAVRAKKLSVCSLQKQKGAVKKLSFFTAPFLGDRKKCSEWINRTLNAVFTAVKACPKAYEGTPRVRLVQSKKAYNFKHENAWLPTVLFSWPFISAFVRQFRFFAVWAFFTSPVLYKLFVS